MGPGKIWELGRERFCNRFLLFFGVVCRCILWVLGGDFGGGLGWLKVVTYVVINWCGKICILKRDCKKWAEFCAWVPVIISVVFGFFQFILVGKKLLKCL